MDQAFSVSRLRIAVLYGVFFASGASAIVYQSAWQRILTLHAGMDLFSVTTVVAAFMAGLGLGNLIGGAIADRLGPRGSVLLYASIELMIGGFGATSVRLLQEWYPRFSALITTTPRSFAFHFAVLFIPTSMMGATLPLLARGTIARMAEITPSLAKLYGVNTLGAALGALSMSGPWILGRVGLQGAITGAAALNVSAGALALALVNVRIPQRRALAHAVEARPPRAGFPGWALVYGLTGFAALGLEVAWFRLLNVVGRSTTYTFSRLLFVYLVGIGLGSLIGGRLAPCLARPARTFIWLQAAVGVCALLGPILVNAYFAQIVKLRWFPRDVLSPLVVLLPPTILMGICFPVMNRLVADRIETLGRRAGALLFANTMGCVLGSLATGFVFLHFLGTPNTLRLLGGLLCLLGVGEVLSDRTRGLGLAAGTAGALGLAGWLMPTGAAFWAPLHGARAEKITAREDGSCIVALIEESPGLFPLYISGKRQNAVPFDDFHVRLGAVPALIHPTPRRALVIGLGIGSTAYGLATDPRVERATCVEICPGELPLLQGLRSRGVNEIIRLLSDRRLDYRFEDGRKFLLDTDERFDLVVTDTLLTVSAFSGSLYSREFYQLVRSRLRAGGIFAQWVPSERILQTVASVFAHVAVIDSPSLPPGESRFLVASDRPIEVNRLALLKRYRATDHASLPVESAQRLEEFVAGAIAVPADRRTFALEELNTDLFPRDEFSNW